MAPRSRVAGRSPAGAGRAGPHSGPAPGPPPRQRERVRAVVEPVLARAGYDLEQLAVTRMGRRQVVRVVVDGDDASLDAVAEVSRAVSAALDAAERAGDELFPGEYQLEVSSPGVDRPLTLPRHWRRNTGRLVSVRAGDRQVTGRVLGADQTGVRLEIDGVEHRVDYPALGPGRVRVEFTRLAELAGDTGDDLIEDLDVIDDVDDDGSVDAPHGGAASGARGVGGGAAGHGGPAGQDSDDEEREDEER